MSKEISIFLCNVQFTKDAGAFCVTGVKLDNATTIATFDPNEKTYNINGKDVQGHFMVDYTAAQIDHNVSSKSSTKRFFIYYKVEVYVLILCCSESGHFFASKFLRRLISRTQC